MTDIVGQVSATRVQAEADQLTATIKSTVAQDKFVFWAGIDGTNNIANKPEYSNDKQSTAIGALKDKVVQNDNTVAKYYPGVGTPGTQPLSSAFPYNQSEANARKILSDYAEAAREWLSDNPGKTGADLTLMMATFSRGSVTGAMVSQILHQEGLILDGTVLIPQGQATIAAALVISPVNTGSGPGNLAFVGVENFTEVIAANDYRSTYKQALYDNAQKVYITGTHGDVGGFYDRGIGGIVTQAYTDYFNTLRKGLVDALLPERQYDGRPLVDVHAERFSLAVPWNISYGSFEENTPLITVPTGTQPTIQRIENGDITTFVNYKGETITTTRIGGALASVVVTPPVSVNDNQIQPFNYSDKYGNSFRTKTDVDGNVLRDANGEVICTVTYNSGSSITQCDVTETGKFLSASDSSTPSTGPTTNAFTQTVTATQATLDTGGTDWNGLAASGGGWKVGAAADTLNTNTDPFSALLGDALTGGIRPGNHNISDTGNRWDATANAFGRLDDLVRNAITDTPTGFYNLDLAAVAAGNSFADQYVPADPLVLDLNGDGVKLTSFTEKTVLFDIDHDGGAKEQTGWVSAQDGVLAMDLNGNGRIDNIGEILSDYFSGAAGSDGNAGEKKYANGFAALKSLDSNADNAFTVADAAWSQVKVWTDANGDALTDAGELKSLDEQGISAIHLTHTLQNGHVNNGNEVLANGTFVRNGSEQQLQAVNFIASAYGQTLSMQGSGTRIDGEAVGGKTTTYIAHSQSGEAMSSAALNAVNLTGNQITGNAGNNTLIGGAGNDTYRFNADFGHDIIRDNDATVGNLDRIVFAAGIAPEQVSVSREDKDLVFSAGSKNQLCVEDWFAGAAHQIERVEFTHGATWTADDLRHMSNHAPVVNTALSQQTATEDKPFSYALPAGVFADDDRVIGDGLTYAASFGNGDPLPGWLGFDAATQTFSGTPGSDDVGMLDLKVTATDAAGASVSSRFDVMVSNVNDVPVIAGSISAQAASEDSAFLFTLPSDAFTDADAGDVLRYSACLDNGDPLPDWLGFDAASQTFSGTPGNGDVGSMKLKVTATDAAGTSASRSLPAPPLK